MKSSTFKLRALIRLMGDASNAISSNDAGVGLNTYKFTNPKKQMDLFLDYPYSEEINQLYYYTSDRPDFSLLNKFDNLTHLSVIIPNYQIYEIPDEIFRHQNLEVLDLSGTGLRSVNPDICIFKNLRCLGLGTNHLEQLPESIGQLNNLEHLYLYNNKLREIPCSINNLTKLTLLGLVRNQIKHIPNELLQKNELHIRSDLPVKSTPKPNNRASKDYCYYFLGQSPIKFPSYDSTQNLINVG